MQHRNWNIAGDLEQLLLRGGVTYTPKNTSIKFTLGYGHITTGSFGEDNAKVFENRIYQEALYPVKLGKRVYLNHRFRFEQRFLTDNFKTRYRYNLFLNVPLNNEGFDTNTIYLALYNEIFVGGYNQTLSSSETEHFDRNRFYSGVGYVINKSLRVQLGYMNQHTNSWVKNQLQFSLHYNRPAKD